MKKKGKGKRAEKKPGAKAGVKPKTKRVANRKKELDPAVVRGRIVGLVKARAMKMAKAVVNQAETHGELAPTKFFFEMAHIHPPAESGTGTEQDEKLVKTLLNAFNISETPEKPSDEGETNVMEARGGMRQDSNEEESERDCRTCPVARDRKTPELPGEKQDAAETKAASEVEKSVDDVSEKVPVE